MKSSTDYKISSAFACLLVGEPKSGKTNIAMAFPDPWFLDLDGNLASAIRRSGTKKFFYDSLESSDPLKSYDEIIAKVKAAAAHPEVKTLVLDSVSSLASVVREHILARLKMAGAKLRSDTLDDQLRISDYQTLTTFILRVLAEYRASGKYVIWNAHQKVDKDELTGAVRYEVHIPGNLKSNLGAFFTDCWAAVSKPVLDKFGEHVKYTIRTKPTGLHINLGASFPIDTEMDVTNKTPEEVWRLISPKLIPVTAA